MSSIDWNNFANGVSTPLKKLPLKIFEKYLHTFRDLEGNKIDRVYNKSVRIKTEQL